MANGKKSRFSNPLKVVLSTTMSQYLSTWAIQNSIEFEWTQSWAVLRCVLQRRV